MGRRESQWFYGEIQNLNSFKDNDDDDDSIWIQLDCVFCISVFLGICICRNTEIEPKNTWNTPKNPWRGSELWPVNYKWFVHIKDDHL